MSAIIGTGIIEGGELPYPNVHDMNEAHNKGFKHDEKTRNHVTHSLHKLLRGHGVSYAQGYGVDGGSIDGGSISASSVINGGVSVAKKLLSSYDKELKNESTKINKIINDLINLKAIVTKIINISDIKNDRVVESILDQFTNAITKLGSLIHTDEDELAKKIKEADNLSHLIDSITIKNERDEAAKLSLLVKNLHDIDKIKPEVEHALNRINVKVNELQHMKPIDLFNKLVSNINNVSDEFVNNINSISNRLKKGEGLGEGGRLVDVADESATATKHYTLNDYITTIKTMYIKIVENFLHEIFKEFNNLTQVIFEISKMLNKNIVYDKNFEKLIEYIKTFNNIFDISGGFDVWFNIIGLKKTPEAIDNREQFVSKIESLIHLNNTAASSQNDKTMFNSIDVILKNILAVIGNYSKVIELTNEKMQNLSLQSVKELNKYGKGDDDDNDDEIAAELYAEATGSGIIGGVEGGISNLELDLVDLSNNLFIENKSKNIVKHLDSISLFSNVVNIQQNLKYVSEDIKKYAKDYDNLLGETMGFKISETLKYQNAVLNSIDDTVNGIGKLLNKYNQKQMDVANRPAGLPENITPRSAMNYQSVDKAILIKLCKWQCEAKLEFYKVLECIDLFLLNFTISLDANIKDIENLSDLLQNVKLNKEWINENMIDSIIQDCCDSYIKHEYTSITKDKDVINYVDFLPKLYKNNEIIQKIKQVDKILHTVTPLKNIISLFSYMNNMSTYKLACSPKDIYKYLKKYICASNFICGFNHRDFIKYIEGRDDKLLNDLNPEDIITSFYVKQQQPEMDLNDLNKKEVSNLVEIINDKTSILKYKYQVTMVKQNERETPELLKVRYASNFLRKIMCITPQLDVFKDDDIYLSLLLRSLVSKIVTSIDVYKSFKDPQKNSVMLKKSSRLILGGSNLTVNDEIVELYVRVPLLIEYYKMLFDDGNDVYKNGNVDQTEKLKETIAYVPDLTGIWSGLFAIIFDNQNNNNVGFYSESAAQQIIAEINKIYANYKSNGSNSIKEFIMGLVYEVNRRYGIIKKGDIESYYNTIKNFNVDNYGNNNLDRLKNTYLNSDNPIDADILDDTSSNSKLPSDKFVKNDNLRINVFTKDKKNLINDIPVIRELREKIFKNFTNINEIIDNGSVHTFKNYINIYKKDVKSETDQNKKISIVVNAIKNLDQTKSSNSLVDIMFYEFVVNPYLLLNDLYKYYNSLLFSIKGELSINNVQKINISEVNTRLSENPDLVIALIELLQINNSDLVSLKYDNYKSLFLDWKQLENVVNSLITQIKSNILKFRTIIPNSKMEFIYKLSNIADGAVMRYSINELEQRFLNHIIRSQFKTEEKALKESTLTFKILNELLEFILNNSKKLPNSIIYKIIMFSNEGFVPISSKTVSSDLLDDLFNKNYNSKDKTWSYTNNIILNANFINEINITKKMNDGTRYLLLEKLNGNMQSNPRSILENFNITLYKYLNDFYDSPVKKFYNKLLDNFYNNVSLQKTRGFYSIFTPTPPSGIGRFDGDNINFNNGTPVDIPATFNGMNGIYGNVNNKNMVISDINIKLIYMLYNRVLKSSTSEVKEYLNVDKNTIPIYMINKFKVLLPKYKQIFKNIIEKCLFYKNLIYNMNITNQNNNNNQIDRFANYVSNNIFNSVERSVQDNKNSFNMTPIANASENKQVLQSTLSDIIESCEYILKDINIVLDEFVDQSIPLYLELKADGIKQYKQHNNNELPFMPASLALSYALNNDMSNHSDMKYYYGLRSIVNVDYKNINSLVNMPYVESLIKFYTSYTDENNKIDINHGLSLIKNVMFITKSLYDIKLKTNTTFYNLKNDSRVPAKQLEDGNQFKKLVGYILMSSFKLLNSVSFNNMDINSFVENDSSDMNINRYIEKMSTKVQNDPTDVRYDQNNNIVNAVARRNNSIIINIIDLNIVPINVHAMLREIPLINIYNYAFTYDDIIRNSVDLDNIKSDSNPKNTINKLKKLLYNETSIYNLVTLRGKLSNIEINNKDIINNIFSYKLKFNSKKIGNDGNTQNFENVEMTIPPFFNMLEKSKTSTKIIDAPDNYYNINVDVDKSRYSLVKNLNLIQKRLVVVSSDGTTIKNNINTILDTPVLNTLMFGANSQRIISLMLNETKNVDNKITNVLNGVDILTNSFA